MDQQRLAYRPDIDGLRAIAVLSVLFCHAKLSFSGGFVGVDVFFVISGFLITSLILRDLENGTFSFGKFWERRIRRILPALIVVVVSTLVVSFINGDRVEISCIQLGGDRRVRWRGGLLSR